MVSKTTAIALVVIIAAPILLGFGLNFETVEKEVYAPNNDPVDVTNLLTNGTAFDYVAADPYAMNSNIFYTQGYGDRSGSYPTYVRTVSAESSIKYTFRQGGYNGEPTGASPGTDVFSNFIHYQVDFIYTAGFPTDKYLSANIYYTSNGQTLTQHVDRVYQAIWDSSDKIAWIAHYTDNTGQHTSISRITNATQIQYVIGSGPFYGNWQWHCVVATPNSLGWSNQNVDINGGFTLQRDLTNMQITNRMPSITFTIDLGSMAADSVLYIGPLAINKRANNEVYAANWDERITIGNNDNVIPSQLTLTKLYYDPAHPSDNCYQFTWNNTEDTLKLDYVGQWPSRIGIAESYLHYEIAYKPSADDPSGLGFGSAAGSTINQQEIPRPNTADFPKMRIDAALLRGFDYPVISDATYDPGVFKTNPGTTISGISKYGTSVTFGSNTYNVDKTDGTITLNGHKIPLNNMTFTSFWNDGAYDNAIGGTVISTTQAPAALTFTGDWSFGISTQSYGETTVTESKWIPGHFAWDGVDTDFKLVGFMASIAAFIGLSVWGRRSGAKVLPLLVVCGGAALMFLVMI